jgi:hypothetical protein
MYSSQLVSLYVAESPAIVHNNFLACPVLFVTMCLRHAMPFRGQHTVEELFVLNKICITAISVAILCRKQNLAGSC